MPKNWSLRGSSTTYEIVTSFDRRAAGAHPARVVEREIDGWERDPFAYSLLIDMLREVGLLGWMPPTSVGGLVREGFTRGLLCVVGVVEDRGGGAGRVTGDQEPDEDEPAEVEPVREEERDWIEIALVDEDDAPVGYAQYSLELPDGSKREGRLDAMGFARIENIDPGTCKVSFPNIDGREWQAA